MSTNNEYKIAIIGDSDTVSGFRALGVEVFNAHNGEEAMEHLRTIKGDSTKTTRYAIVCIIEDLLKDIDQTEYAKVVAGPLPAVVILPGTNGTQGFAIGRLRRLAEQAVGASII